MRLFATGAAAIGLAVAVSASAVSQESGRFPSKPVTLIVPWPAGGSTDIAMRAMSEVAATWTIRSCSTVPSASPDPRAWTRPSSRKLHDAFKAAIEGKSVVDLLGRYDMPVRYMDSAGYTKFVDVVTAQERAVLDRIGLLKKD